ncbi:MAG: hypothetical protein HYU39_00090 [Thaumarchaeota archaeon]|nr:hypothetical protein [Nitrososphaerota archaeon]
MGIDKIMNEEMTNMQRRVEERLAPKFAALNKEKIEKDLQKLLMPDMKRWVKVFKDLGLVVGQTLPEQALVLGVSAFEVYMRELTSVIVANNPLVAERFNEEIKAGFTLGILAEYRDDAKRTKGEVVADTIKLDPNRLKLVLKRMIGWEQLFPDQESERFFVRIIESRNLVIHRAGLVDPKFKRVTRYKGSIDHPLKISRKYTIRVLNFLGILGSEIHKQCLLSKGA